MAVEPCELPLVPLSLAELQEILALATHVQEFGKRLEQMVAPLVSAAGRDPGRG